jgi:hypothetical protein
MRVATFVRNGSAEAAFLFDRRPPASPGLDAADERLTRSITDVLDMFLQLQPQVGTASSCLCPRLEGRVPEVTEAAVKSGIDLARRHSVIQSQHASPAHTGQPIGRRSRRHGACRPQRMASCLPCAAVRSHYSSQHTSADCRDTCLSYIHEITSTVAWVKCMSCRPALQPLLSILEISMPVGCHQPASRFGGNVHQADKFNVDRSMRSNKEQAGPGEHCAAVQGIGARLLCSVLRVARRNEALLPEGGSVSDAGWLQLAAWLAVEQVGAPS